MLCRGTFGGVGDLGGGASAAALPLVLHRGQLRRISRGIGIGVFWWVRTGQAEIRLLWLVVADLVTVTLTVGWLAVIRLFSTNLGVGSPADTPCALK